MVTKQDCLTHRTFRYLSGTYSRSKELKMVRASGKCQTWKTRPDDFRLPVKYGMYESLAITPENASLFITEDEYQRRKEQAQAVGQVLKNPMRGKQQLVEIAEQAGMLGWHVFVDGMYDTDIHPSKTPQDALKKAKRVYPWIGPHKNLDYSYYTADIQKNPHKRTFTTEQYELLHDGVPVTRGTNLQLAAWIHAHHSYSLDHALKYEGYSIRPAHESIRILENPRHMSNPSIGGSGIHTTAESRELFLFIIDDGELYRQRTGPIILNLQRKIKRGVYKPELAVKLWRYLADAGAKKYTHEMSLGHLTNWRRAKGFGIFTVPMRNGVARELHNYYSGEVQKGATMKENPLHVPRDQVMPKLRYSQRRRIYPATELRTREGPQPVGKFVHVQQQRGPMWFTLAVAQNTVPGRKHAQLWAQKYHRRYPYTTLRLFV